MVSQSVLTPKCHKEVSWATHDTRARYESSWNRYIVSAKALYYTHHKQLVFATQNPVYYKYDVIIMLNSA